MPSDHVVLHILPGLRCMVGLNDVRRPLESTTYVSLDIVNKSLHVIWTGCSTNQSETQQFLLSLEHPEENEKPLLALLSSRSDCPVIYGDRDLF